MIAETVIKQLNKRAIKFVKETQIVPKLWDTVAVLCNLTVSLISSKKILKKNGKNYLKISNYSMKLNKRNEGENRFLRKTFIGDVHFIH